MKKLKAITDFLDNAIKEKKIYLLNCDFPSFSVSQEDHYNAMYSNLKDKLDLCLELNKYNNKTFKDLDVDTMIEAQEAVKNGTATEMQKNINIYSEKVFSHYIAKDSDIDLKDLQKTGLMSSMVDKTRHVIFDLSHDRIHSYPYEKENFSTYSVNRDKLSATIVLMENQFPQAHKQVLSDLRDFPNEVFKNELNTSAKNACHSVAKHIFPYDHNLASDISPETKMMGTTQHYLKKLGR